MKDGGRRNNLLPWRTMKGIDTEAGMKEKQRINENIVAVDTRKDMGLAKELLSQLFLQESGSVIRYLDVFWYYYMLLIISGIKFEIEL